MQKNCDNDKNLFFSVKIVSWTQSVRLPFVFWYRVNFFTVFFLFRAKIVLWIIYHFYKFICYSRLRRTSSINFDRDPREYTFRPEDGKDSFFTATNVEEIYNDFTNTCKNNIWISTVDKL